MIRKLSSMILAVTAVLFGAAAFSHAQLQPVLTHQVREATRNGQAPMLGRLPAKQTMNLRLILPLRNQDEVSISQ
jgi:hypothetical protein